MSPGRERVDAVARATGVLLAILGAAGILARTVRTFLAGTSPTEYVLGFQLAEFTVGLSALAVGGFLVARRPRNAIGWILLAIGSPGTDGLAALGIAPEAFAALGGLHFMGLFALLLLLFPDGRPLSRAWWGPASAVAIGLLILVAVAGLRDEPGPVWEVVEGGIFAPGMLVGVLALVVRYRRSEVETRYRIRWFVLAATAAVVSFIAGAFAGIPYLTNAFALPLVPVGIGVAVLRHRLYDIDRIISRSVSYVVLTLFLAGVYAGGVVGLGWGLRSLAGDASNDLVVAASTLAVAVAFVPARRRIQQAVDRRFDRAGYDAAVTITRFGQRLRDQIDADTLVAEVRRVTAETFLPAHVTLWTPQHREVRT